VKCKIPKLGCPSAQGAGTGVRELVTTDSLGTKKLSTIRQEVEEAFASTDGDPIRRLEQLIAATKRKGGSMDVMQNLKRFLELPLKGKPAKQRFQRRTRDPK
jgi:hypothetical protein